MQPPADEIIDDEGVKDDEEEEEVIPTTPVPKEWECLGSDLEIKEGFMAPGRPLVRLWHYFHIVLCTYTCR